jgi:hypothetical protein
MKKYVLCYLEWKEEGVDVSGNRITPEITAHYEEICEMLRELGEKLP